MSYSESHNKTTVTRTSWKAKEIAKLSLILILRILLKALCIFPIKKNRIVFHSFKGKQYSCNPKAITEYLIKEYPNSFEIVWAFREPEKFNELRNRGIVIVPYISLKRVFWEVCSGFSINNFGSFNWLPLRKSQVHLNTWHGGGCYKRVSSDPLSDNARRLTSEKTTHMISSSAFFSNYVVRGEFGFKREILEVGMPRNDIFFYKDRVAYLDRKVRNYYGIGEDKAIVLYAPTWRFDTNIPHPDLKRVAFAVKEYTGKATVLLSRTHNFLGETIDEAIDVTSYPDMQDLLCAADCLITDYSSSIWDYSFLYRPCFLYVNDLDDYINSRGFDRDIDTWGFPVCRNNDELYGAIVHFDKDDFIKKMKKHHKDLGSFEDGHATEKICSFLCKQLKSCQ